MKRWVLAATVLGSSMAFIDTTVVNVALPVVQRDLGATAAQVQWIADAYLLVVSALILAGGSLGDRLGRVRVFAVGVAIFAAASICCGAAQTTAQLIAARALQGGGAALLVPGSLAIIAATFSREERGRAIGTWSALTSLSVIAGPLLGGALVQAISWRAVFLINAPIAIVVLWIVRRHVPRDAGERAGAIDWLGTLLVTLGLGGVVFAFIEAPARGWTSIPVAAASIAGVAALIAFVPVERRASDPIVPFALFRSRAFTAANVLTLLLYAATSAATFLLPFNLIQVQGYSPAQAGAAFLPFVATMSLMSRWTGALADRVGARPLLITGPLVVAIGFTLMALPGVGGSYWTTFFPAVFVLGFGMAITVAPLTTTVMTSIDDERHAGAASGINNAVARTAGLLAIAILGALAVFVFSRDLDERLAAAHAPATLRRAMNAQSLRLAAAQPPPGSDARAVREAVQLSFVHSFRVAVVISAALAALAAVAGIGVGKRRQGSPRTQNNHAHD
jgi:EmrB/QacA subfamily drug resistance transporter